MPRIPEGYLDSVIYLYRSSTEAKEGRASGGSGFLVGVPSEGQPELGHYVYAVTNKHVVEQAGARTIRLNTIEGGIDILETDIDEWERPSADDLAVRMISLSDIHSYSFVKEDRFVTKELIQHMGIGPGDEVFVVGRFIDHQGLQCNTPSVRFGNISMMPGEPVIRSDDGSKQDSFLVDLRSMSGYSGSPAFAYIFPSDLPYRTGGRGFDDVYGCGPWLLGVDWGHIDNWLDLVHRSDRRGKLLGDLKELGVSSNAGMAGIVPAWKLAELLHCEDLTIRRREQDEAHGRG